MGADSQPARRRGRPSGSTAKSAATRERIFVAAVTLFAERGYAATTMRGIADAAETAVGLAYRYFPSKDAIVGELYRRQAARFETIIEQLPDGTIGDRFVDAMRKRLASMAEHRSAIAGLLVASLDPESPIGVLNSGTQDIRDRVGHGLRRLVADSRGAPPPPVAGELAELLYAAHLAILLFWLNDRTGSAAATDRLLHLIAKLVDAATMMLAGPLAGGILRELAATLRPVFHPPAPGPS